MARPCLNNIVQALLCRFKIHILVEHINSENTQDTLSNPGTTACQPEPSGSIPIRLKRTRRHRSATRLGRAWHPQNSSPVGRPKLKSNLGEYFRLSPVRRLQPSHRYQHAHTSPYLHGFCGLFLLLHRPNLILKTDASARTINKLTQVECEPHIHRSSGQCIGI